jgi:hypothetical protein
LKKYGLAHYRRGRVTPVTPAENRALAACAAFRDDVLLVESEHDDIIPHPEIENYLAVLKGAHSLTYRVIEGADHALSDEARQQAYTFLLLNWAIEMVLGARRKAQQPGCARISSRHHAGSPNRAMILSAPACILAGSGRTWVWQAGSGIRMGRLLKLRRIQ